ncbi:MAG: DUF92 domain-containing protein [Gemmatimonadetes bacterium]|nr:DUF92 domain-containing protein [Gemmatimonadota bacterium]
MHPLAAVAISFVVAGLGWASRALSRGGFAAAVVVGTSILSATGLPGLAALGVFFVSSTLVSRMAHRGDSDSDQAVTEVRDHLQVLANGGAAAAGALAEFRFPGLGLWLATVGLAAAASDTWSTAFGALSGRTPRDILTGQRVAAGTSGGVTWAGTVGGLVGGALVALGPAALMGDSRLFIAATTIGFAAMLLDSALGSAWQARFWCPGCQAPTERRVHRCGSPAIRRSGWAWLDNNGVNAAATAAAVLVGLVAWWGTTRA